MVAAEGPPPSHKLHYAQKFSNLNEMNAASDPRQENKLLHLANSYFDISKVAFPGPSMSGIPASEIDQTNGVHMFQNLPYLVASSSPNTGSFLKESPNGLPNLFGAKTAPNNASGLCQKHFIIFDRSGNETRILASPFSSLEHNQIALRKSSYNAFNMRDENIFSPLVHNQIALGKSSYNAFNMRDGNVEMEKIFPMNLINEELAEGDAIFCEASEMHEDTDEINALLYSDSHEGRYYSDDDEDEVTSTGCSPLETTWAHDKQGQMSNGAHEVASSDGPSKRQKLLNGEYKSTLVDVCSSMNRDNDAEPSNNICINLSQDIDSVSSAWEEKVKIRETLEVLQKIIPGLKSDNPMLIIDGAIDYLKSLRLKAETLGICYSQVHTTSPN